MLRLSNILCPLDFDQGSLRALSVAADIALEHNATLYLLHVIHLHIAPEPALSFAQAEKTAQSHLEQIGHQKLKSGTRFELMVISGDAAGEILQMATRLNIDLIVMATHGRKGLRRLVLGSVAERVVREAPCLVLTIKPSGARAGASRTQPRTKRRKKPV